VVEVSNRPVQLAQAPIGIPPVVESEGILGLEAERLIIVLNGPLEITLKGMGIPRLLKAEAIFGSRRIAWSKFWMARLGWAF